MKTIRLARLDISNFKGIEWLSIDFGNTTNIYGDNGTGKTSIFDAFTWLLFGCDSNNRCNFEARNINYVNPVRVSAELYVNDEKIMLTKEQKMVESSKTYSYYVNDEEYSQTDYKNFIQKEFDATFELAKSLVNIYHFNQLKEADRRDCLMNLIDIEDSKIIAENADLSELEGRDLPKLKERFTKSKKKMNKEIEELSIRIDEHNFLLQNCETSNYFNLFNLISKRKDILVEERKANQDLIIKYEKYLYLIDRFYSIKMQLITDEINSKFSLVKFKMFTTKADGEIKECCICTRDGVEYNNLNTAKKINAGIDIANAFSKHYGVSVPIFIDNCESVNKLIATDAQQIRLFVSKDKELKII